jgi:hypothetical protein
VIGGDFENIGTRWLCNKKFLLINMISSATLWTLWKIKNNMCFQNVQWRNMKEIVGKIIGLLHWTIPCPMNKTEDLKTFIANLERRDYSGHIKTG